MIQLDLNVFVGYKGDLWSENDWTFQMHYGEQTTSKLFL